MWHLAKEYILRCRIHVQLNMLMTWNFINEGQQWGENKKQLILYKKEEDQLLVLVGQKSIEFLQNKVI